MVLTHVKIIFGWAFNYWSGNSCPWWFTFGLVLVPWPNVRLKNTLEFTCTKIGWAIRNLSLGFNVNYKIRKNAFEIWYCTKFAGNLYDFVIFFTRYVFFLNLRFRPFEKKKFQFFWMIFSISQSFCCSSHPGTFWQIFSLFPLCHAFKSVGFDVLLHVVPEIHL